MTPTIADIAAYLNVSKTTVSRVLNNKPDVSPETVKRVKAAMEELGYVPSMQAVSLAKGKANCIGMLVPALDWPVVLDLLHGVTTAVERSDYGLMLHTMTRSEEAIQRFTNQVVRAKQIDGLIVLTPPGMIDYLAELHHNGLPTVLIDDQGYNPTFPTVTTSNLTGGYSATQHLINNGRRHIAFINGPKHYGCNRDRFAGYCQALREASLTVSPQMVYEGDFTVQAGIDAMRTLFAENTELDGIFAGNDLTAIGAMRAIREAGLRIPEDIAVVGFDNINASAYTTPPLTTVHQPFFEMGQAAVNLMLSHLNGTNFPDRPIELPTSLVIRESSG